MIILKDCSHFLHEDKPEEFKKYLLRMLEHIDATEAATQQSEQGDFEIKHLNELPDPVTIDDDALSMDVCVRDFKMVHEKREDGPWFFEPFRGHRGLGLLNGF